MNKEEIKLGMKLTLKHVNNVWEEVKNYDCVVVGYSLSGYPIVEFEEDLVSRVIIVDNLEQLFPRLREVIWWACIYKDSNQRPQHTGFFRTIEQLDKYPLPRDCEWISVPIAINIMELALDA